MGQPLPASSGVWQGSITNGGNVVGALDENTLDQIVREWARAQIQRMDIVNYNGAQLSYNHQADMSNRLGLSEKQKLGVTPYPCPTNQTLEVGGDRQPEEPRQEERHEEAEDNSSQSSSSPSSEVPNANASGGKSRSLLWPTLGAAALSAALTAGSIGGTAWVMSDKPEKPAENTTEITNPDGRVGVDVIGWPENPTFKP